MIYSDVFGSLICTTDTKPVDSLPYQHESLNYSNLNLKTESKLSRKLYF